MIDFCFSLFKRPIITTLELLLACCTKFRKFGKPYKPTRACRVTELPHEQRGHIITKRRGSQYQGLVGNREVR
jgi:hypothetical protein